MINIQTETMIQKKSIWVHDDIHDQLTWSEIQKPDA